MEQENCNWFVFYKDQILILQTENGYHVPCCTEPPVAVPIGSTIHTIGEMNGLPCKTYSLHTPIPGSESPARQMMGLRASFDFLPLQEYQMGGKAFQILNWDQNSRYCPACGVPTHQISHCQEMSAMPTRVLPPYLSGHHRAHTKRRQYPASACP